VPVIAEAGQPLNRLPCLGRVLSQQLIGDNLVQRYVQPRAERLAAHRYLFTGPERIVEFCVLGLDEKLAQLTGREARLCQLPPPPAAR
jgi:hypothetical protein